MIAEWEQRYLNTLYVPEYREECRRDRSFWRAPSLGLRQHSSGNQQQHKPNPCNRVSASSAGVYSKVIQCPFPPAASSITDPVLHLKGVLQFITIFNFPHMELPPLVLSEKLWSEKEITENWLIKGYNRATNRSGQHTACEQAGS